MPYTKFYNPWHDADSATGGGDTSTPLTAEVMDHIEQGISDAIPKDLVDAKGDLIVGSAADTAIRKAVGADSSVLSASAGDTGGVTWRKVGNAMVADDAAIAVSKLAPGSSLQILQTVAGTAQWAGAYATYTPTWVATVTPPAIGDAVISARYIQIGNLVHAFGHIAFGASSTFGAGDYRFAIPVAATTAGTISYPRVGVASLYDASSSQIGQGIVFIDTGTLPTRMGILYSAAWPMGALTQVGTTTPFTWAASDVVHWSLTYEAA